ncbi:MAG: hypothetical protein ABFD64_00025 [Armatimonadota bacterium]
MLRYLVPGWDQLSRDSRQWFRRLLVIAAIVGCICGAIAAHNDFVRIMHRPDTPIGAEAAMQDYAQYRQVTQGTPSR